jgi:ADP-heptose:LPS heptosyltransferase
MQANAKFVIANDTGLAHAAAAMKKKILILWKDTKFPKNSNISDKTEYLMKEDWINGIKVNCMNWEKIKNVFLE